MPFRFTFKLLNFFFLSVLAFINLQCGSSDTGAELTKLQWLTGRWEMEENGIKTIETWQSTSENNYAVTGYMLEGKDTIFTESITVKPGASGIFYTVTIADQNNGEPVAFRLKENTGTKAVFVNPEHDFPQTISYSQKGRDSVLVQLTGTLKGKQVKEHYTLHKN